MDRDGLLACSTPVPALGLQAGTQQNERNEVGRIKAHFLPIDARISEVGWGRGHGERSEKKGCWPSTVSPMGLGREKASEALC